MKSQIKSLRQKIEILEAELQECTTAAQHTSVYRSLDAAWRRYQELTCRCGHKGSA